MRMCLRSQYEPASLVAVMPLLVVHSSQQTITRYTRKISRSRTITAKPQSMCPETTTAKGIFHEEKCTFNDARQGYSYWGFALKAEVHCNLITEREEQ